MSIPKVRVGDAETALAERAKSVLPAGNFGNIGVNTIIQRGKGGRVWDLSGNEYVDFLLGSGPMLVGHAHPEVNDAVQEQLVLGSTYFANNVHGIALAEAIVEAMPCAEKVRFASSGTEADLFAMRLARAHRKRDKILKFEGAYHGMSDYGLMSLWPAKPGNSPHPVPDSAGIPRNVGDNMLVTPYNDLEAAKAIIREYRDDLGGVIVEPMQRLFPPKPGFLEGLRDITADYKIPLIFDEVVTGFRLAYGGGQEYYGIIPDLCTLGKVIGGGYPLSAIAGREEIMAHFDKSAVSGEGFTPVIGTLSGNPIAAVAGLATLKILKRPGTYEKIFETGKAVRAALSKSLGDAGWKVQVPGEPPMFDAIFTPNPVYDYRSGATGDASLSKQFNEILRSKGIFKSDNKIYISLAHDAADIEHASKAFSEAAHELVETTKQ